MSDYPADLPRPEAHHSGIPEVKSAFADQCRLLERMLDDESLSHLREEHADHPLVMRFDAFKAVAEGEAIKWPAAEPSIRLLGRQLLDAAAWAPSGADTDVWAALPDEVTRDYTRRNLRNPEKFEDTMAELFFWGKLRANGLDATRRELEGHTDIGVVAGAEGQIPCEVKRLHEETRPRRVGEVVKKANRQAKATNPEVAGVVLISLGLPLLSRAPRDGVPVQVEDYLHVAYGATRGEMNRSAGLVVVSWEEIDVRESMGGAIYFLIRNYRMIEHEQPRHPVKIDMSALDAGQTLALVVLARQ